MSLMLGASRHRRQQKQACSGDARLPARLHATCRLPSSMKYAPFADGTASAAASESVREIIQPAMFAQEAGMVDPPVRRNSAKVMAR